MPYISKLYDDTTRDLGWSIPDRIRSMLKDTKDGHLPVCVKHMRNNASVYISRDHSIQTFLEAFEKPSFLDQASLKEVYFMTANQEKNRYEGCSVVSQDDFHKCLLEIVGTSEVKLFLEFA